MYEAVNQTEAESEKAMSACQCASVAGTSLSPEGNITTTTDVLKVVGGVVNTCPAVLWSWPVKSVLLFFAQCFFLTISVWYAGKS